MKEDEKKTFSILMVEDDEDFCVLTQEAIKDLDGMGDFKFVGDGEEALDYLTRSGKYQNDTAVSKPDLILLDLNMPKKNGLEALKEIRSREDLRMTPVIMLTISRDKTDVIRSYAAGANSFISKPLSFSGLSKLMAILKEYWFKTVILPSHSL